MQTTKERSKTSIQEHNPQNLPKHNPPAVQNNEPEIQQDPVIKQPIPETIYVRNPDQIKPSSPLWQYLSEEEKATNLKHMAEFRDGRLANSNDTTALITYIMCMLLLILHTKRSCSILVFVLPLVILITLQRLLILSLKRR